MHSSAAVLPADLSASHELLHALLLVSLTGVILFHPVYAVGTATELVDLAYGQLNPAAQRMLRLPAHPVETFLTLYPNAVDAGIFAFYRDTFLSGQPGQYAVNYSADGLDNFFLLSAQRSGELLLVSFTDTAEQQRSAVAEALRESQAREQTARAEAERQRGELERVFEQAPVAIFVVKGPTYILEVINGLAAALVNRPQQELVGRPYFEALPELATQGFPELLHQAWQSGQAVYMGEMPIYLPGRLPKQPVYFTFVYQPLFNAQGQVHSIACVGTEVTKQVLARHQVEQLNGELEARVQQRTREALALQTDLLAAAQHQAQERATQQQELEQLFRQAPAPIVILDGPDLVFQLVNPAYQRIFPGRELAGKPLLVALPELVGTPIPELFQRVYQTGEPITVQELPLRMARHEGHALEEIYWTFTYQARRTADGHIDGVRVFAHDVTEQVRIRQQVERLNEELAVINQELQASNADLNESNAQLTRTNVDLDTFVYTASHDLKAPITNIEGILAALCDTLPPAVQQEDVVAHLLSLLDKTVRRFLTTIDQLTDLSRLQRAYDAPAERLVLASVVADVVEDLAPVISAAAAQVHLGVPAELHVSFAPASLRSIVYNLLSNAVKYRDPARPAQVWLRAESQPGAVVLSVRDNGLGLSDSQQGRLFGVFQRLHTHVEGTGVGLYMIKRLIENAGARIAVVSAMGVGSTFTVTFPI